MAASFRQPRGPAPPGLAARGDVDGGAFRAAAGLALCHGGLAMMRLAGRDPAAAMLAAPGTLLPVVGAVACPAVAEELTAGLFVCGEGGGAFGAKNFAQAIITNIDNSEATKMRSSGRRPFSFCGSLTNVSRP